MRALLLVLAALLILPARAAETPDGRALYRERCDGCHGPAGRGGGEGGVTVPPIDWPSLAVPRLTAPARPGFDSDAFDRAVTAGIDPAGRPLAPPMASQALDPAELAALRAYLRIIGSARDRDPGIGAGTVRIGTVLPLTGPDARSGQAIRAALERSFATAGPIFGRRLELQAEDAGGDTAAAFDRLADGDIFALVATRLGSFAPGDLPIIGPLAPSTQGQDAPVFYLLATTDDQLRLLVDALADAGHRYLAVLGAGPTAVVAAQLARSGGSIVPVDRAEAALLLPGSDPVSLLAALPPGLPIAALASDLPPGAAASERLTLVAPVGPGGSVALAEAAAGILIEGLKRAGAQPTRLGLIDALDTLDAFPSPGLPPQSFRRGRHVGTRAALVLRPGVSDGDWREPR